MNWATKVMHGAKLKDFQFIRRAADDGYAIGARVQLRQVQTPGQLRLPLINTHSPWTSP